MPRLRRPAGYAWVLLFGLLLFAGPAAAQVTVLHSFAGGSGDGQTPVGSQTHSGSTLYGMTSNGGAALSRGTVYRIGVDGTGFGPLHSSAGGLTDGQNPSGSLIRSGPTLYGMTQGGGSAFSGGTVFRPGADGSGFTLLHKGPLTPIGPCSGHYGGGVRSPTAGDEAA